MAVRIGVRARAAVAVKQRLQGQAFAKNHYIRYTIDGEVFAARKLDPVDFSPAHLQTISSARLLGTRRLIFDNPEWHSVWLGAGEEKTVFLVVDEAERAFALELIVRAGYLNGKLTEGYYLAELRLSQFVGVKRDSNAMMSLEYNGMVKAREFIYGETLAGPAIKANRPHGSIGQRLVDKLANSWAKMVVAPRYTQVRGTFDDAHAANVMIELIPLHNPERKKHYMLPVPVLAADEQLHWYFYRLTPIDVRARAK